MHDNVSKRTSVRALAWKRGDVADDDPRQRVAIEALRVPRTHVGSMVWMRMHERNDFQSQTGCGGANRVAVGSGNLEGTRELRVIGDLQEPLPAGMVNGVKRAHLVRTGGALPRHHKGERGLIQPQRSLRLRH